MLPFEITKYRQQTGGCFCGYFLRDYQPEECLKCFAKCSAVNNLNIQDLNGKDLSKVILWNNKFICIGDKSVYFRNLAEKGILRVGDLISNKNALSSCESRLLGNKFCWQMRRCCYTTFSFGIQNECYMSSCKSTQKVKIARSDRPHILASNRCETFENLLHIDIKDSCSDFNQQRPPLTEGGLPVDKQLAKTTL